ncbi:hypothetical protein HMPREF3189_01243 [Clostridiales bacterium KA00134]|nr:hypothetical protein HMPREF3189_01243 [Clostridiales bacterium KA00134]
MSNFYIKQNSPLMALSFVSPFYFYFIFFNLFLKKQLLFL